MQGLEIIEGTKDIEKLIIGDSACPDILLQRSL
jgi:hypothetical protein